jgi:hypothetical protein
MPGIKTQSQNVFQFAVEILIGVTTTIATLLAIFAWNPQSDASLSIAAILSLLLASR